MRGDRERATARERAVQCSTLINEYQDVCSSIRAHNTSMLTIYSIKTHSIGRKIPRAPPCQRQQPSCLVSERQPAHVTNTQSCLLSCACQTDTHVSYPSAHLPQHICSTHHTTFLAVWQVWERLQPYVMSLHVYVSSGMRVRTHIALCHVSPCKALEHV